MRDQTITIECDCSRHLIDIKKSLRQIAQRLDVVEDAQSDIFDVLDSLEDFSDLTEAINQTTETVRTIGQS